MAFDESSNLKSCALYHRANSRRKRIFKFPAFFFTFQIFSSSVAVRLWGNEVLSGKSRRPKEVKWIAGIRPTIWRACADPRFMDQHGLLAYVLNYRVLVKLVRKRPKASSQTIQLKKAAFIAKPFFFVQKMKNARTEPGRKSVCSLHLFYSLGN